LIHVIANILVITLTIHLHNTLTTLTRIMNNLVGITYTYNWNASIFTRIASDNNCTDKIQHILRSSKNFTDTVYRNLQEFGFLWNFNVNTTKQEYHKIWREFVDNFEKLQRKIIVSEMRKLMDENSSRIEIASCKSKEDDLKKKVEELEKKFIKQQKTIIEQQKTIIEQQKTLNRVIQFLYN